MTERGCDKKLQYTTAICHLIKECLSLGWVVGACVWVGGWWVRVCGWVGGLSVWFVCVV